MLLTLFLLVLLFLFVVFAFLGALFNSNDTETAGDPGDFPCASPSVFHFLVLFFLLITLLLVLVFFISWCYCCAADCAFTGAFFYLGAPPPLPPPPPCLARQRAAGSRELQDRHPADSHNLQPRAKTLSWDSFNRLDATRRGTRLKLLQAFVTRHASGFRV